MIEMSDIMPPYRKCNSCGSGEDVREIKISFVLDSHSVGSVIALCKKCRKELEEVLRGAEI